MTELNDLIHRLEAKTNRNCTKCRQPFVATGLQGICDTCSDIVEPARVIVRELGDSWPERHRARIPDMAGPSLERGKRLLPLAMGSGMIVLVGDRGRGKTQLATWMAWQRGQAGKAPGIYTTAFDVFAAIKSTWGKNSAEGERDVLSRFKKAAFLCVDECHERGETDWENRTMRNILDHRYLSCLPTVLIGNWRTGDEISASLGASITDRITETGGIVWCKWESYRTP